MPIVTPVLLDAFPHRVVNIHPSLFPAFPGVNAQAAALAYGVRITGCTDIRVDAGTDTGCILAQAAVPVLHGDTEERLSERILHREHQRLVHTLDAILQDKPLHGNTQRTPAVRYALIVLWPSPPVRLSSNQRA